MSLAVVATRLLAPPSGKSERVRTIALVIGAFTLIYRWYLRRKDDWNLEPPHSLVDSLYFSATVFTSVGFGDISPKSSRAKLTVLAQMAALLWTTL